MDPRHALIALGGVARTAELHDAGVSRRSISLAVAREQITRVREGVYVLPGVSREVREAARLGGKLAARTAADEYGLWTLAEPGEPDHIWVPPTSSRVSASDRFRVHWDAGWSGDSRNIVSVSHALWQMAMTESAESFLVSLESALNKQLIDFADLEFIAARLPKRARCVTAFAVSSSQSGLETLVRWRLSRAGITAVPHVVVEGVGTGDLLVGRTLIIETDGRATHDFYADRARDLLSVIDGKVTIRLSSPMIHRRWDLVEGAVRAAIGLGLHELGGAARSASCES